MTSIDDDGHGLLREALAQPKKALLPLTIEDLREVSKELTKNYNESLPKKYKK